MVILAVEVKDYDNSWENGIKTGQKVESCTYKNPGLGLWMNTIDNKEVK